MPLTTVLLADLPPMLEDMVSSVLQQRSDLQLIHSATGDRNLIDVAVASSAQVVIVVSRNPVDLASIDPYLANAASLSIVALAPDGGSACLHAFKPESHWLDDVSAEQILASIIAATPIGRA